MMYLKCLQFGYFILFCLLKLSAGQALVGETGSNVTLVIEFSKYPLSCNEICIRFQPLEGISSRNRVYDSDSVMTSTNNGVRCLSIIDSIYENRIFNVSINFPTYVTFGLQNVSVNDSGWYYAMKRNRYYFYSYDTERFGKRLLLVSDTIFRACTLKQMEFEFVLPLSVFNETVAVVFCSGNELFTDIISICNPEAGTCVPPSSNYPRFQCRMNGSSISITLTPVKMADEGIYTLLGSTSRVIYQSAVLNVIECVSNTLASDIQLNTTELPNLTTVDAAFGNTGISYSRAILSSAAPITDQSFVKYFVGGGAVTGIAIVILTCWFLWKRCFGIRGNVAGGDDYDTVDVHYYCTIRNENQRVTECEATAGSVPESQQLSAVMEETNVHNDI